MIELLLAGAFCLGSMALYYSKGEETPQQQTQRRGNTRQTNRPTNRQTRRQRQQELPYSPSINRYVRKLWKSEEGRRVWEETDVRGIYRDQGSVCYADGSNMTIHLNNIPFVGYAMFCHELRHLWQYQNNPNNGWVWEEFDANTWSSGRCAEAGDLIGAAIGLFMSVDPVTFIANSMYYSSRS